MKKAIGSSYYRATDAFLPCLLLGLGCFTASAQTVPSLSAKAPLAAQTKDQSAKHDVGYLEGSKPNFLLLLPPYPVLDTKQDEADVATLRQMQEPDQSPRWKLAQADAHMTYARFVEPLGIDLDPAKLPVVIYLLSRVERDVLDTTFEAKSYFDRPRPFQRFAMTHVCGADTPPTPETHPTKGSSYPSGHTAFGWGVALTLAEIAPERAQSILIRGREYGESRIVCAVHYPSDVAAGQVVATAVVERLHSVPEFSRDLACAKEEYQILGQPDSHLTSECKTLESQLTTKDHQVQ